MAACRNVSSAWGICCLKSSSLPLYSPNSRTVRSRFCVIGWLSMKPVVLENSNMAKLASKEYLSVHSQPKEDRHDIDDASSGKVYDIFMPQSRLSAVQSLQRRHDRSSFLDG